MRTTFELTGLGDLIREGFHETEMENGNCIQGEPKENQYSKENRSI